MSGAGRRAPREGAAPAPAPGRGQDERATPAGSTADLLRRHAGAWRGATRHPFLDAVRDGALPAGAFAAWLAQDYLFAGDLLAFQARLLARAPRPAQAVLAGGLVALEAELTWFEEQAAGWGVALGAERHPVTAAYRALLGRLQRGPYPAAAVGLWALERAYLEAWRTAAPSGAAFRPFVEHWTVPAFAAYVDRLAGVADTALAGPPGARRARPAEAALLDVARLERQFWDMAWGTAAASPPARRPAGRPAGPASAPPGPSRPRRARAGGAGPARPAP
jgi:thiaminase/transcriptional activator TenA